jgi:hypothetical protein
MESRSLAANVSMSSFMSDGREKISVNVHFIHSMKETNLFLT